MTALPGRNMHDAVGLVARGYREALRRTEAAALRPRQVHVAGERLVAQLERLDLRQLLLEPELLDVWRARTVPATDDPALEHEDAAVRPDRADRHLRLVRPDERERAPQVSARRVDPLAPLLRTPEGTVLPELPDLDRIEGMLEDSAERWR